MEPWREAALDELKHYGVKGMKWRRRKSAIADYYNTEANDHYSSAKSNVMYGAKYKEWNKSWNDNTKYHMKRSRKLRNTAKAVSNGRPAPRLREPGISPGKGLYKRGPGLGTGPVGKTTSNRINGNSTIIAKRKKKRAQAYINRRLAVR